MSVVLRGSCFYWHVKTGAWDAATSGTGEQWVARLKFGLPMSWCVYRLRLTLTASLLSQLALFWVLLLLCVEMTMEFWLLWTWGTPGELWHPCMHLMTSMHLITFMHLTTCMQLMTSNIHACILWHPCSLWHPCACVQHFSDLMTFMHAVYVVAS